MKSADTAMTQNATMRVLIADDERPARARLRRLPEAFLRRDAYDSGGAC